MSRFGFMGILVVLFQSTTEKLHVNKAPLSRPSYEGGMCHLTKVEEDGDNDDDNGAEDLEDDDEEEEDIEDDDEDSEDDVAREETEEEFLKRYALVAVGESIEIVEEGDIDEETQDIELDSLEEGHTTGGSFSDAKPTYTPGPN
ncbi:uncharacterized protein LOC133887228 isoform X2 [Phragmites australis]|uniref:uncharacterized protein LOC133887228 isoform X2 n=1 Tax=Phragmites australis TaxID=29695 RepID=UPI002D7A3833|nr:uncharacterized protein LOC133887228 isoform X2 [Phragmites australis]